jgi:hypothetical protein
MSDELKHDGPTTPNQFSNEMRRIFKQEGADYEFAHAKMDNLMAKVLVELGYGAGIAVFDKQEKWYA